MFHCAAAAAVDMNINRDYVRLGRTELHKSSALAAISSWKLLVVDTGNGGGTVGARVACHQC